MQSNADVQLTITFAGRSFVLGRYADSDLVAQGMSEGHYEAPLPMLIMAALARMPGVFLDVGSNNGLYSILAAKTRAEVTVVAFEPYPPVAAILRQNIAANDLNDRVHICEVALSDSAGRTTLYVPDPAHGLVETSASLEADFKPGSSEITVERIRLDDMHVGGPVTVMKVDIEGHEAAFFRGALGLIRRDRPIVFAEMLQGAQHSFQELSKYFQTIDYLLFRLRPQCVVACDAIVYDPQAWNYGFIPKEKLATFADCCRTHSLELYRAFE